MLSKLNRFIIGCSQSWWKFLLIFLGFNGTMFGLQQITARFPAVTDGDIPFDMQNKLRPDEIFAQLEGYTDQAFELYAIFQVIDYVFPVVAGLLLATVCAFSLRHASTRIYQIAADKNLFVLLLVPTAFDYMENFSLLRVIMAWPEQAELAGNLAVFAKFGKLNSMNIAFAVTGVLMLWAAIAWLRRRFLSTGGA